jgi:hypothetical protein
MISTACATNAGISVGKNTDPDLLVRATAADVGAGS